MRLYCTFMCIVLLLCVLCVIRGQEESRDNKQHPELSQLVRKWAEKLSGELWHFGELVTRRSKVIKSFNDTSVEKLEGEHILQEIHDKITNMMKQKVEAVERIMDIAEQAAKDQKEDDINLDFQFINAKNLSNSVSNVSTDHDYQNDNPDIQALRYDDSFVSTNDERYQAMIQPGEIDGYQQDQEVSEEESDSHKPSELEIDEVTDGDEKDPLASQVPNNDKSKLPLYPNRHFYNIPVNTNYSAVHVPSNVYERSKDVIAGIIWSEELDKTFRNNYKHDPTLSWQYFGSSTGFMRQFPAMIWSKEPINLFDCRMRSWYIEAASSPKNIIILVDRSGSMTGMRREIAKHVVHNILDTLGNNDYVNIFTFSNTTDPLVNCFDNMLVQANLANVRVFKESMNSFKTEQIANFSLALITAFELLEDYRKTDRGANCNEAIMLITDGVQYNYKEIFDKYNWQNLPFVNVRVFTYLIGREVSDVREIKWMACANRGYYVHLSTYAEVREEVLQYIPVMARPMVLNATLKPNPAWSPVYADVTDPKLTNWLWVYRERNRQRERFLAYRRNKTLLPPDEQDKKFVHQQKQTQDQYGDLQTYRLMTSVSLPVYDKKPRAERVANLLGVAGTDVPIEYIQMLMLPSRLGVNGYAFIVTNNGYILTHPDLRPVFQGILKPAYNRVDMTEVEILDDDAEAREFSDDIKELRRRIVTHVRSNATFKVKSHLSDMKRLMLMTRHYFYRGIENTPFSLVVALPHKYGFWRIKHKVEHDIHRLRSNDKIKGSLTEVFTGNWTVHPDWHYCRYLDDKHSFDNPAEEFIHFVEKMESPGWKWTEECDRKLTIQVVADAKITSWFSQNITTTKEENGSKFIRRFGITVAFMATHSGFTRWQYFPQNIDPTIPKEDQLHFHILHNKAIDEVWYKRAVEYYYIDKTTFVYSVPFEIGNESNALLTVSNAIFREEEDKKIKDKKAPAAVIGYQFYQSALYSLFKNITGSCGENACKRTCESKELHCLLIDDNGYVIMSYETNEIGHFFGKFRPDIMTQLVEEGIYKITKMYDYQGLCSEEEKTSNPANSLITPLNHLFGLSKWILGTVLYFARSISANNEFEAVYPDQENHEDVEHEMSEEPPSSRLNEKDFDQRLLITKTKPEPCDYEMWLYSLMHYNATMRGYNKSTTDCSRPFIVQRISGSNMILLVINELCQEDKERGARMPSPVPAKIDYNMTLACYRVLHNNFPRRHYMSCIKQSVNESEIKLCGGGFRVQLSVSVSSIVVLVNLVFVY